MMKYVLESYETLNLSDLIGANIWHTRKIWRNLKTNIIFTCYTNKPVSAHYFRLFSISLQPSLDDSNVIAGLQTHLNNLLHCRFSIHNKDLKSASNDPSRCQNEIISRHVAFSNQVADLRNFSILVPETLVIALE